MKALMKIQAIIFTGLALGITHFALLSTPALAFEAAVGPIAGTYPGLSFQVTKDRDQSYHLGMQVSEENAYIVNLDIQRVLVPNLFYWADLATTAHLYGGVGALMSAKPDQKIDRLLYYHMPVGLQFNYTDGIVHTFIEVALLLGPMPKTTATLMPLVGLRTRF